MSIAIGESLQKNITDNIYSPDNIEEEFVNSNYFLD